MIRVERSGAVLRLILDRAAKKNALTGAMYTELSDAIDAADADAALAVLLIEGQPGAFCAGNDLADFAAAAPEHNCSPCCASCGRWRTTAFRWSPRSMASPSASEQRCCCIATM